MEETHVPMKLKKREMKALRKRFIETLEKHNIPISDNLLKSLIMDANTVFSSSYCVLF